MGMKLGKFDACGCLVTKSGSILQTAKTYLAPLGAVLTPASRASPIRTVKIAVIDGFDISLTSFDGKIAIDKSFCPYAHLIDHMSSYHVPSVNHDTCMAMLVRKFCLE